jgi:hypothetical protein
VEDTGKVYSLHGFGKEIKEIIDVFAFILL